MISNPCSWFINGNEMEKFTYEGGKLLFHFSPYDNGLRNDFSCNVIFFANDPEHARDVLKRMLQFRINVAKKYIDGLNLSRHHAEEFHTRVKVAVSECKKYLKALDEGKIKLSLAPVNQFYRVGWGDNDTILT